MDLLEGDHRGKNSALLRNLPVFSFERMSNGYRILFCMSFRADGPMATATVVAQTICVGRDRTRNPRIRGLRALLTMETLILT